MATYRAFGGPPIRLRLRHGVTADSALDALRELIGSLERLRPDAHNNDALMRSREEYLQWVEWAEIKLTEVGADPSIVNLLQTRRYWAIRELVPGEARPVPLISGERDFQRNGLIRFRDELEMRIARARGAPGHVAVLDTHTLLHYQRPDSVTWSAVVGHENVRLLLPLRVIEELDGKKYGPSDRLRPRARSLLSWLDALPVSYAPTPLANGVTLEVWIEPGIRVKPDDADEEILDNCWELWHLTGQDGGVTLVTNDTGMRIRGEGLGGIRPVRMPERYLRDDGADTS